MQHPRRGMLSCKRASLPDKVLSELEQSIPRTPVLVRVIFAR